MKKYKLKKDLPLAKAWTEVYIERFIENESIAFKIFKSSNDVKLSIAIIEEHNIDIWLEEIQEKPKSIFDLKKWGTYYYINHYWQIQECRYIHYENLDIIINNWKSYISYEEAEKELKKRQAIQRIKKYCWENNIELADKDFLKNPENAVAEINYDREDKKIDVVSYRYYNYINIELLFRSHHDAKNIVENCKNDLKIIFDV